MLQTVLFRFVSCFRTRVIFVAVTQSGYQRYVEMDAQNFNKQDSALDWSLSDQIFLVLFYSRSMVTLYVRLLQSGHLKEN